MKFEVLIRAISERFAGANALPVLLLMFFGLIALLFILWHWGAGFLMALPFVLVSLQLVKSVVLGGVVMAARYPLVVALTGYAIFSHKNKAVFSKIILLLGLLPLVMILNSGRSWNRLDAFGQGIVYLFFFFGLIIGGQKILSTLRGRAAFVKTLALFTVVMTCMQIPFWGQVSQLGRFAGAFENVVGFMTVGMTGVIVLLWFGMKQKPGSVPFIFYIGFATVTLAFLVLTGGRTALGGVLLGILVVLSRKLGRNIVISLAVGIILVPIGFRIVTSFAGFEAVRQKFTSRVSSGRSELQARAWDHIKIKPLVGWGTGISDIKAELEKKKQYHNSYLQLGIDHGIPFASLMMLVFAWLPFRGYRLMRKCQTEEMKDMANLSSALLAAYFLVSQLGGTINTTTGVIPVFAAIGLQEGVFAENRAIQLYDRSEYAQEEYWDDCCEEIVSKEFTSYQEESL